MLSYEAKRCLYELYLEYKVRRSNNMSRKSSKDFGSDEDILNLLFPEMNSEDLRDLLTELSRNNFLNISYSSGVIYSCELTDFAISKLECQPTETLCNIANFVSKFIL